MEDILSEMNGMPSMCRAAYCHRIKATVYSLSLLLIIVFFAACIGDQKSARSPFSVQGAAVVSNRNDQSRTSDPQILQERLPAASVFDKKAERQTDNDSDDLRLEMLTVRKGILYARVSITPNDKGRTVALVKSGSVVVKVGRAGEWFKIRFRDRGSIQEGWVYKYNFEGYRKDYKHTEEGHRRKEAKTATKTKQQRSRAIELSPL